MCVRKSRSRGDEVEARASNLGKLVFRKDFPGGSHGKACAYSAGDLGSIPGSGRSPGEGNGHPLQYHCLENPIDRGAGRLQSSGKRWGCVCFGDLITTVEEKLQPPRLGTSRATKAKRTLLCLGESAGRTRRPWQRGPGMPVKELEPFNN